MINKAVTCTDFNCALLCLCQIWRTSTYKLLPISK